MNTITRLFSACAAAALLSACATVTGGGRDVASMPSRFIDTAQFATVQSLKTSTASSNVPHTFFYSGAGPSGEYWLDEKKKAPVDIAGRVIYDAQINGYLNDMASQLTRTLPESAPKPRIFVYGSPAYEAMALPTGDVFISISVLAQAQSEDEVAALLGHEIGHVVLAHHDADELFEDMRKATSAGVATLGGAAYMAAAVKSGSLSTGQAVSTAVQGDLAEDIVAMKAAKLGVDFIANDLVGSRWKRGQELDADLFGLDLMTDAGYNPNEFEYGINRLAEGYEEKKIRLAALEPALNRTGQKLGNTMLASVASGGSLVPASFTEIIQQGGAEAGFALFNEVRGVVSNQYTDPETRYDQGIGYIERFYSENPLPDPRTEQWKSQKIALRIDALNEAYVEVSDALASLGSDNFQEALQHIEAAHAKGPISQDPFPRHVEALARQGAGDPNGALSALRSVAPGRPLSLDGYILLAELEASHGSPPAAISALDRADSLYGIEATADNRILILSRLNKTEEAREAYTRCSNNMTDDTKLRCNKAAQTAGLIEESNSGGFLGGLLGTADAAGGAQQQGSGTSVLGSMLGVETPVPAAEPAAPAVDPAIANPAAAHATGGQPSSPLDGLGTTLNNLGGVLGESLF